MGFHKRYIDDEQIIDIYTKNGCQAVIDWFTISADAIITSGELSSQVYNLICNNKDSWNKISELISDASIKKGFKK
jgi:hypothetical protein